MMRCPVTLLLCTVLWTPAVGAQRWTLTNPTGRVYEDEVLRLKVDLPAGAKPGEIVVTADGKEVPYQIGEADGKPVVWVAASLGPDEEIDYAVSTGRSPRFPPKVKVSREGACLVLDNGLLAVRVPAVADGKAPGPVAGVRLPTGRWVGASAWHTGRTLTGFSATVLGDGTIFAKVCLRYEFAGTAGLRGDVPAFAEVDVSLLPGQRHVVLEECHEMSRGDAWTFDAAAGWGARRAEVVTHGRLRHAHGGQEVPPPSTLKPGQTRMGDTLLRLQPRWSQAFDEGWFFACHDRTHAIGAMVCRPVRWHWPHNNLIAVKVRPSADYAGLRCPTWKGRRYWFLLAGPRSTWEGDARKAYVTRHGFQPLDKLVHYVLDWPGIERLAKKPGGYRGVDLYSGSAMNPSSMVRGIGKRALREAGRQGNLTTLARAQVYVDPDTYGSYWNFWSPENPNFFTDFSRVGIALVAQLKGHPRFKDLARQAEQKFREDLYHAITLPGGAGQECPGYVAYAMTRTWRPLAQICREHLGFDPTRWPRYRAGAAFLLHVSQPVGGGKRRCHPGGDTHPPGPDVMQTAEEMGVCENINEFKTEERPGFGVVFRNRPGTDRETYLALKSGPNRGHYHGDQLSLHWCAGARPLAIDHMCSYSPRAGQEHMHNRVAFHTDRLPWANMDGYERVIAFKPSAEVDVAVGQVESERLRVTTKYPPEEWDTYLPQERFQVPLRYRRTIVMLKGGERDTFVIRDQHDGAKVRATWCLHVLSDACERDGRTITFDRLTVFCARPRAFAFGRHDWMFEKKDRKSGQVLYREETRGIRLTAEGNRGEFITVLWPGRDPPPIEATEGGVRVGKYEVAFDGGIDDKPGTTYVTVTRSGKVVATLTGGDVDLDRSQGEIGLFVPDAGYPFGVIPDWLIRQRCRVPDWAPEWAKRARRYELPR